MEDKVTVPISWDINGPDKVELGDCATFEVTCKEKTNGNPFDIKGQLTAILFIQDKSRGLCEEEGRMRKPGVGEFTFDFVPHIAGQHQLRIQHGHQQLFKNIKITLDVLKEVPEVSLHYDFELEGKGLLSARIDEVVYINMTVKEGNKLCDIDQHKLSVNVQGNGRKFFPSVIRKDVGTYQISCSMSTPGVYVATVVYENVKVIKQRINVYEITSARCSKIENIVSTVPAGQPCSFTMQSLDMHGNLTGVGGDQWEVKITEGTVSTVPLKIVDHKNGKYTVEFSLTSPGVYKFDVTLLGETVKKSPFKIKAE